MHRLGVGRIYRTWPSHSCVGRNSEAVSAIDKAVRSNDLDDGIHFLAAHTLVDLGQYAKAQQLATALEGKLQQQPKSLALLITGDIALKQNRLSEAVGAYREARKLQDSWISHFLLGKAYVEATHFPEALAERFTIITPAPSSNLLDPTFPLLCEARK